MGKNKRRKKPKRRAPFLTRDGKILLQEGKYTFKEKFVKEYTLGDDTVCLQYSYAIVDERNKIVCVYKMSTLLNYPTYQMDEICINKFYDDSVGVLMMKHAVEKRQSKKMIEFSPDFSLVLMDGEHPTKMFDYIAKCGVFIKDSDLQAKFPMPPPINQSENLIKTVEMKLVELCDFAFRVFTIAQVLRNEEVDFLTKGILKIVDKLLPRHWVKIGYLSNCSGLCVGTYDEKRDIVQCEVEPDFYYRFVCGDISYDRRPLLLCNNCFDKGAVCHDKLIASVASGVMQSYSEFKETNSFMASISSTYNTIRIENYILKESNLQLERKKRKFDLPPPKKKCKTQISYCTLLE